MEVKMDNSKRLIFITHTDFTDNTDLSLTVTL